MSTYTIEKFWDGNERAREVRGRIYISNGRWQWDVRVDGVVLEDVFDSKREAVERVDELKRRAK